MIGSFEWKENGPIESAAAAMSAIASADYDISRRFRDRIQAIVEKDNDRKLDQSIDKDGKPLARLAKSTLAARPRPGNRPLDPAGSAFRLKFKARWDTTAKSRWVFVAWYAFPHAVYHLTGTRTMPRRDLAGLSPQGKAEVRAALKEYADEVKRSLSVRGRVGAFAKQLFRR